MPIWRCFCMACYQTVEVDISPMTFPKCPKCGAPRTSLLKKEQVLAY